MNQEEFKLLIESIGFIEIDDDIYVYKEFIVSLWKVNYNFYNGSGWIYYDYNDLSPFYEYFKRELRSYKLKQLLR